jgi:anti-anti-sigma factor
MASSNPFFVDRVDQPGGPVLLRVRGELDVYGAPLLRSKLLDLLPERPPLVVDLQALDFMDSSGLAVLLELRSRARQNGWTVSVRGSVYAALREPVHTRTGRAESVVLCTISAIVPSRLRNAAPSLLAIRTAPGLTKRAAWPSVKYSAL